jgi:hypothetical protein
MTRVLGVSNRPSGLLARPMQAAAAEKCQIAEVGLDVGEECPVLPRVIMRLFKQH